jgi:hypothetical protein
LNLFPQWEFAQLSKLILGFESVLVTFLNLDRQTVSNQGGQSFILGFVESLEEQLRMASKQTFLIIMRMPAARHPIVDMYLNALGPNYDFAIASTDPEESAATFANVRRLQVIPNYIEECFSK